MAAVERTNTWPAGERGLFVTYRCPKCGYLESYAGETVPLHGPLPGRGTGWPESVRAGLSGLVFQSPNEASRLHPCATRRFKETVPHNLNLIDSRHLKRNVKPVGW